jgi:methylmalonyl-CoA mutase
MTQNEMSQDSFPQQTLQDWKQKVADVESLTSRTYEDVMLKPLYTKEDLQHQPLSTFPGSGDYRRGANPLGYISNPWEVAQKIHFKNIEDFKRQLHSSFQKGQTSISFTPSLTIMKHLPQLFSKIYQQHPFSVNGAHFQKELIETLIKMKNSEKISGFIGKDPIALYIQNPRMKLDESYDGLIKTIESASSSCPQLKTILIDTTPYHNSGATAVQEIAIALSTAVQHIEEMRKRGLELKNGIEKFVFHFSINSHFFMEIAKLRAIKVLWSKILEAYKIEVNEDFITVSAETSSFTKTVYDPYVNLLRAGNESLAAILGGVQFLHISPYNELEGEITDLSDRVARNMHFILRDEARLSSVIDPAGGSWYIESLTNALIENAWNLFLEIDQRGGIITTIQTNWLQKQINKVMAKRDQDVRTRNQIIVGTNKYELTEDPPLQIKKKSEVGQTSSIEHMIEKRLSEKYEELRKQKVNRNE